MDRQASKRRGGAYVSWALLREAQKDRTLGARQLGRRQVLAIGLGVPS